MVNVIILIPSFNNAKTIEMTLVSLQEQEEIERVVAVYLADDGSCDQTISLAEKVWDAPIPLIILQRGHNVGQWNNVNDAFEAAGAEAEWVLILHADDMAKSNWLQLMLNRAEHCAPDVASICSSWDTLYPNGSISTGEDAPERSIEKIYGDRNSVVGTLRKGCWWHISGSAIRKHAFDTIGHFSTYYSYMSDFEWLLRCLQGGWAVEYIPRTLILYRQHIASVSSTSLLVDKDIRESLGIVQQYVGILSIKDLTSFHFRHLVYALRRFGRAISRFHIQRSINALETFGHIWLGLFFGLGNKYHDRKKQITLAG